MILQTNELLKETILNNISRQLIVLLIFKHRDKSNIYFFCKTMTSGS